MIEFFKSLMKRLVGSAQDRQVRKYSKIVRKIHEWEERFNSLSDEDLKAKSDEFKNRIRKGESLDDLLPEAYAVVKSVCRRLVGTDVHVSGYDQKWDMIPYDVQLIGGIAMHYGAIAEMQTGEGKTLTAVLPLYLNALSGKPVHLVTVNDYLAERDCEWVGCVLRWLGLTTAALTNSISPHMRKEIYQSDVVYGTASEFGFDYLRDNSMALRKEEQAQRGYFFAIVDEIDSILIDEARTPLIISGPAPESYQMYEELKGGISAIVKKQRDLCNRMATEAKKELSLEGADQKDALRKLWIVSKGTPRNKILKRVKEDPDYRAALDKWDLYFYSDQNKEEKEQALAELFIIIDEKLQEFELTDKGIASWQDVTGEETDDFVMYDLGHEYYQIDENTSLSEAEKAEQKVALQEKDANRKERAHNLRQLFRAHLLMERDVDYIVQGGKVVIIDENTGRAQSGRRFADGLHQSIEAKEGVVIEEETQTYATVTLQNYFRMYEKLSGMTGTAITEAGEFKQIYKLDVLQIPTHKPCIRKDENDDIFMTEREKWKAILEDVKQKHSEGRPILIGTESVEVSEKLSRIFRQNGIQHVVLNAKNNEKEAEIVAIAGHRGSITVATNMAGRGTDIKLDEGVTECGGLYVLGTSRHQSRRLDRQLSGRCARQGDPGSTKFYLCFEDALLRLFASPRITSVLQRLKPPEGEPISASILNRSIQTAQKRVEQRNFMARKHTLEYDDVMNKQREEIYAFRNEILQTDEILSFAHEMLRNVCFSGSAQFFQSRSVEAGWDPEGYRLWLMDKYPVTFSEGDFDDDTAEADELAGLASDKVVFTFDEQISREKEKLLKEKKGLEESAAQSHVEYAVRNLMVRELDQLWQHHLLTMDHLRADVSLRTVGQRDPLMEFKHEAFSLFDTLTVELQEKMAHQLFRFELVSMQPVQLEQILAKMQLETNRSLMGDLEGMSQPAAASSSKPPPQALPEPKEPVHIGPKVGRNDPCPCGSGKKYKKCCEARESDE